MKFETAAEGVGRLTGEMRAAYTKLEAAYDEKAAKKALAELSDATFNRLIAMHYADKETR